MLFRIFILLLFTLINISPAFALLGDYDQDNDIDEYNLAQFSAGLGQGTYDSDDLERFADVFGKIFQAQTLKAFPGAEGFGANVTGGRGGDVVYVTNLDATGSGSFYQAMRLPQTRYVLFKASGTIAPAPNWDAQHNVQEGDVTVAGHTSPGGIVVRGLYSSVYYGNGPKARENIIIRHMRSRRGVDQDNMRLLDARNVIVDHCSFAWASDEVVEITSIENFSLQNSIFAETLGSHYNRGGVLMLFYTPDSGIRNNYITLHHNVFNRIYHRLPHTQCSYDNDSCKQGLRGNLEVSENLYWDPGPVGIDCTDRGPYGEMDFNYSGNYVNNYFFVPGDPENPPHKSG